MNNLPPNPQDTEAYARFQLAHPELFPKTWDEFEANIRSEIGSIKPPQGQKNPRVGIESRKQIQVTPEQLEAQRAHLLRVQEAKVQSRLKFHRPSDAITQMPLSDAKKALWGSVNNIITNFSLDAYNEQTLNLLAHYFSGNDSSLDPKKGLFVFGCVGVGKTDILRACQSAFGGFQMVNMRELSFEVQAETSERKTIAVSVLKQYLQGRWAFDDIGHELKVQNFGTFDIAEELITQLYERFKKIGRAPIFTSNLSFGIESSPVSFEARYSERACDRIKEMCNIVCIGGSSKR